MAEKAIREVYGETLLELGGENSDIVVLESDVGNSTKSVYFGNRYPEKYFNVGIAEGNMAAMAAGFASAGKIPFINTFSTFMALRAGDPINSLIAYSNLNVKLAGAYSGISDSYDGASHHSLSDIAVMRSLPNITVISVADAAETEKAVRAAANHKGPVYLRLSRACLPDIFGKDYMFEIGKGAQIADGGDLTIFATGSMVHTALEANKELKKSGIGARVVDIHTIKPIDRGLIVKCAKETGAAVTAEEHSIVGGLGGAVAEVLAVECPVPMRFVGIEDTFTESGDYGQLREKYGLSVNGIIKKAKETVKQKN